MLSIWDSFADLPRIQREFERSFGDHRQRAAEFSPAVDVHEDSESVSLSAELPGIKQSDIEIQVDGNVLTLRGERKLQTREEDGRKYHRIERSYGMFARQFHLPTNIDATQIDAQLTDGVLTIKLPKRPETKARKIEVRSGGAPTGGVSH